MKSTVAMISPGTPSCLRQDFLIDFLRIHVLVEQLLLGCELDDFPRFQVFDLGNVANDIGVGLHHAGDKVDRVRLLERKLAALAPVEMLGRTANDQCESGRIVAQGIELVGSQRCDSPSIPSSIGTTTSLALPSKAEVFVHSPLATTSVINFTKMVSCVPPWKPN